MRIPQAKLARQTDLAEDFKQRLSNAEANCNRLTAANGELATKLRAERETEEKLQVSQRRERRDTRI